MLVSLAKQPLIRERVVDIDAVDAVGVRFVCDDSAGDGDSFEVIAEEQVGDRWRRVAAWVFDGSADTGRGGRGGGLLRRRERSGAVRLRVRPRRGAPPVGVVAEAEWRSR